MPFRGSAAHLEHFQNAQYAHSNDVAKGRLLYRGARSIRTRTCEVGEQRISPQAEL